MHNEKAIAAALDRLDAEQVEIQEEEDGFVVGSDYALELNRFADMSWYVLCIGRL